MLLSMTPTNAEVLAIDGQKLSFHPQRVGQWLQDKFSTIPVYVEVSPVSYCNHTCSFCALDYVRGDKHRLPTGILLERLQEMGSLGVKSVMFAGEGEPLLHHDIATILSCSVRAGIDTALTTNGIPVTQQALLSFPLLKWIRFSVNAGSYMDYRKIHSAGEHDWDRLWNNIKDTVSVVNKANSTTRIGIQCVLLEDNAQHIHSLIDRAKSTGVHFVIIKPYSQHPFSINRGKEWDYEPVINSLKPITRINNDKFSVIIRDNAIKSIRATTKSYPLCLSVPYFWAYISSTFNLHTCSAYLGNDSFNLGCLADNTFSSLWTSERRKQLILEMSRLDISQCRKGCRMDRVNEYLWRVVSPEEHDNFI